MLAFKERLGQFAQLAAPSIDELMAMVDAARDTGSVGATLALLDDYGRVMHHIADMAAKAGLSGLHALCALVETNVVLLHDDQRPLTPEEAAALAEWPMLMLGYLANRADSDACEALLQGVSANWPISLPLEAATIELELLMGAGEAAAPADEAAPLNMTPPELTPGDSTPAGVTDEVDASPFAPESAVPESLASESVAPEDTAPEAAPPGPALSEPGVSEPGVSEPAVSDTAFSEPGVPEPTAREDSLHQSSPPSPVLCETGKSEPEVPETVSSTSALPEQTAADGSAPEESPLEAAMAELGVPEPGISADAIFSDSGASEQIASEDAPVAENASPTEGVETAEDAGVVGALLPPADAVLQHVERPLLNTLLEELKPLDEAFESVIGAATEGGDEDRLAALGDLLDFLERLKITVETIGLTALAALLGQISNALLSLPGGFGAQHRDLLQRLPRAMMAYLSAPDAPAASAGLVVLLADERWPVLLSREALAAWRTALSKLVFSESPAQALELAPLTTNIGSAPVVSEESDSGIQAESGEPELASAQIFQPEAALPEQQAEPEAEIPIPRIEHIEPVHVAESEPAESAPPELETLEADSPQPKPGHRPLAEAPSAGSSGEARSEEGVPSQTRSLQAWPSEVPSPEILLPDTAGEHGFEEAVASGAADTAENVAIEGADDEAPAPLPPPETGMQHVERPMLDILLDELQPLQEEFASAVAAATHGSEDERLAALGELLDFLERVKVTVEAIGLTALAALLTQVSWELISLAEGLTARHQELLNRLPPAITRYLQTPDDDDACAGLAVILGDTRWPAQVSEDALVAWQAALADIELSETSAELTPARATHATLEDVSLNLPADVNSELLEGLLHELPVQVSAFTTAITSITGPNGTRADSEQAMRSAHTLKGAANTVGIPGIANLTHHIEDILVALIEADTLPRGPLADMLVNAGDCLEAMSEFLLGLGPAPDDAQTVLQQVLDCANRMDGEGLAAIVSETTPVALGAEGAPGSGEAPAAAEASLPAAPASAVHAPSESEQAQPAIADAREGAQGAAPEQSLRVPAPLVDELLSLAGETLISNSQLQDHLKATLIQNRAINQQHQLIQRLLAELETQVDIRGVTSQQAARHGDDFDALEFEHYSELQTISRQLMEAAIDAREMSNIAEEQLSALEDVLDDQLRLQMANQRALLRTRMMPVNNVVPRLQRSVRQTGRLLDKPVQFTVTGENTSMDSNVLNDLMDPLMHMLRNAVDHGIEAREARLAAGKPEEGHIELSFAREGDTIVVRCRDDGAGLNYDAIRRIAESKGMIMPGHVHSHDELARLILAPGFSTRGEASQVSGRGVGMDVVYSRIQQMKGMLALHSQTGHGLTVELRIPASLLSMHTLIIRQREKRLAISTRGIEDIRYVLREDLLEIGARQFVRDGDKLYGLLRLEQVLSMPHDRRAKDRHGHPVLMVRMEDGTERAVLVQEILESREVVMKKFNRFVPQANGVIGAAILGNGEVAPVIDLFDLLHTPMKQFIGARAARAEGAGAQVERHARRALVVDDSLSARRAVVQVLKDEGYEIRTANDGLDAVSILEKWVPDIVISDMEMPRMNGLELTTNIRHTESTKHVPVIMITSRSTAKHRQMSTAAGVDLHMIKPFSDDELARQVARLMGERT